MAYIIDSFDKYDAWDREHARYTFVINDNWYAIKEVILFWGKPQLPLRIGNEKNPETYFIYGTFEEALKFVQQLKSYNGR